MFQINVKRLECNEFKVYGQYADLFHADTEKIGEFPIEFYRDMLSVYSGATVNGYSIVRTGYREMIIDEVEQHCFATEVLMPLDGDVIVFVAPSTNQVFPAGKTEAFLVPRGTMLSLKPGVWHKAPFPASPGIVDSLVVLPERAYANDCIVVKLEDMERIKIQYTP